MKKFFSTHHMRGAVSKVFGRVARRLENLSVRIAQPTPNCLGQSNTVKSENKCSRPLQRADRAPMRKPLTANSLESHSIVGNDNGTTTATTDHGRITRESAQGIEPLAYPDRLLAHELVVATELVSIFSHTCAQEILDEWNGIIHAGKIRSSRIGCLRGLAARAQNGTFSIELGIAVATARERRKQVNARLAEAVVLPPPPASWANSALNKKLIGVMQYAKTRKEKQR